MAAWLLQQVVVDLGLGPWGELDEAEVALPLMEPMYPGGWGLGGTKARGCALQGGVGQGVGWVGSLCLSYVSTCTPMPQHP